MTAFSARSLGPVVQLLDVEPHEGGIDALRPGVGQRVPDPVEGEVVADAGDRTRSAVGLPIAGRAGGQLLGRPGEVHVDVDTRRTVRLRPLPLLGEAPVVAEGTAAVHADDRVRGPVLRIRAAALRIGDVPAELAVERLALVLALGLRLLGLVLALVLVPALVLALLVGVGGGGRRRGLRRDMSRSGLGSRSGLDRRSRRRRRDRARRGAAAGAAAAGAGLSSPMPAAMAVNGRPGA